MPFPPRAGGVDGTTPGDEPGDQNNEIADDLHGSHPQRDPGIGSRAAEKVLTELPHGGILLASRAPLWNMRWRYPGGHSIATRSRNRLGQHAPPTYHSDLRLVVGPDAVAPATLVVGPLLSRPRRMTVARSRCESAVMTSRSGRESARTGMIQNVTRFFAGPLIVVLALLAGCGGSDGLSPSLEAPAGSPLPADSAAITPTDSTLAGPIDSTLIDSLAVSGEAGLNTLTGATAPGIVFGTFGIKTELLGSVHTGSVRSPGPADILSLLAGARAKGARMVIDPVVTDASVKNADGTFSLTKWKSVVGRFKGVNFSSYIADGTVLGIFLLDEADDPGNWGRKTIPTSTIEAMAQYSKTLWPTMTTIIRTRPTYLANGTTYRYLDATWIQYQLSHGSFSTWTANQVAAAKRAGLGLIVGLNVLRGGNTSSSIPMSASQLKSWGTSLLNQTYACGYFNGRYYDATYFGRSDIKTVMADLSNKAKAHIKTSCRQ